MNLLSYNEMKTNYETKLHEAEQKKAELKQQYYQAQVHFKNCQYELVEDDTSGNRQKVTKARQKMNEIHEQVKEIDQHIELVREVKMNRLKEAFPSIVEQLEKQHSEAVEVVHSELDKLKEMRCQIVLKALELRNKFSEVNVMNNEINSLARELSVDYKFRGGITTLYLFNEYEGSDKRIAPTESEINEAYNSGEVEPFILAYGESGKLMNNREAVEYLKQKDVK